MSEQFFSQLKGFSEFSESADHKHYHPAPRDWYVVLTDVAGSTRAIEEGRYKDVNLIGAACIAATVNACKDIEIPYVFGGDGATLLIPPTYVSSVSKALLQVKRLSETTLSLALRVGIVPMEEILKRGKQFDVAKYIMPTGCALAMFQGGGANLADDLVKYGDGEQSFLLEETEEDIAPDLSGLSCRWQPIKSRHDTMLTMLVMLLPDARTTYQDINQAIHDILASEEQSAPAHQDNLQYRWPARGLSEESKLVLNQGKHMKNLLYLHGFCLFFWVLNRFNLSVGNFQAKKYREEIILNSDYRKFDDMIRMVVDCTHAQAEQLEMYFQTLYEEQQIVYGVHYSLTALMTCFVPSTASDGHVHFIDGDEGGYAMAATQLKQQLAMLEGN